MYLKNYIYAKKWFAFYKEINYHAVIFRERKYLSEISKYF